MKEIIFNHDWYCKEENETGEGALVTLPHDAMITEPRSQESRGIHNIGWFAARDYVYTKRFTLPKEDAGKRIFLEIEGAYHHAEVYVNGQKQGYRPYGYSDFYLDVTDTVSFGAQNVLEIHTKNSDQPNSRWYSGTGLYRPVHLYVAQPRHICLNGVRVRTLSTSPACVEVTVRTTQAGRVSLQIFDGTRSVASAALETIETKSYAETSSGQIGGADSVCAAGSVQITIADAVLWDSDTPHLYRCEATYEDDTQEVTFGIRSLKWDAENGISINGRHVILRGACIHHDNGVLGACAFPEAEERKIRLLKETGYNAVRCAHNPCSKALLEACDRLGMLVMDEYVDMWYIHKTEYDYANEMTQWWRTDLKEMVDKDYNHPSVILYSTGNEVAETAQERGIRLTGDMTAYLHELDGTRPVSCGVNIFFNFLSSIGFGIYSDEKAKKEAQKAAKSGKQAKKKPVGSEFYNTLAGMFGDYTMKLGATLHPCDVKTRDAYANMDVAGYNYGIFRYKKDLKKYPNRLILGSETFCKDAYAFYEMAKKNPRLVGDFVWSGMDYIGEAGIGAWEYEDYAPKDADRAGWLTAGSGRIDITGYAGGEALYTKVALEQTDDIYIAVKPVYHTGKHSPSAWKMTEAQPSWSYHGCDGMPASVEVYARAAAVELFINGKSIGKKQLKNTCAAVFHTTYADGELTAVAYDEQGRRLKETSLKTAGETTKLTISPESSETTAEGLTFIRLIYTDADGIWKPMEKHTIRVETEHGSLAGLGNACSYNPDGYTQPYTKTYYGRALAVVRADGTGPVKVTISDETDTYTLELACNNGQN